MSRPAWARGLKYRQLLVKPLSARVAPHAGAWIEMTSTAGISVWERVAPHAGAWIEIGKTIGHCQFAAVAPHVGAWVEISSVPSPM